MGVHRTDIKKIFVFKIKYYFSEKIKILYDNYVLTFIDINGVTED